MTHLDEKMLVKLLDDSPDAMLVIDSGFLIVLANRQAEVLFGYGHSSLVGTDAEQLITLHHADLGTRTAGLLKAGRRRDGSTFQAEVSLSTMDFGHGVLTTASIRDLSTRVADLGHERARARRTRRQSDDDLSRATAKRARAEREHLAAQVGYGLGRETLELPRGTETILIADNEVALREVTRRILARNGYNVLTVSGRNEAIALAKSHLGRIDLLLTDVASLQGATLASEVRKIRHGIRVLFMSGHAQPAIEAEALLGIEMSLIEKPFDQATLLCVVRKTLDAADLTVRSSNT